jgi:hypothetical protein
MDFRIDELNQGLSLGLIVTVFTGMYFFASSIYLLENLELISSMSFKSRIGVLLKNLWVNQPHHLYHLYRTRLLASLL